MSAALHEIDDLLAHWWRCGGTCTRTPNWRSRSGARRGIDRGCVAPAGPRGARGASAGTGVVGTLRHGRIRPRRSACVPTWTRCRSPSSRASRYASRIAGVHHGCGHDGHTAMLLGAAQQLARTRRFDGTVHFIFQPAEEGRGGARVMVEEGLFERFPCDARIRAAQLARPAAGPCADAARARSWPRPTASTSCCAAAAAMPRSRTARPTCCSRRASSWGSSTPSSRAASTRPNRRCCPSRSVHGGSSHNVLPAEATVTGTVRSFDAQAQDCIEAALRDAVAGIALAHGVEADVTYHRYYPAT